MSGHPVYENGSFAVAAIAAPANVDKVEATFKEEIAKVLKDGFPDEEIAAAKKGWAQDRAISRSEDRSLASTLADNEYEGRTMAFQKELDEKISALTGQQIVEAMRRHIDPAKLSYVKAGDFNNEGEDGDTVAEISQPRLLIAASCQVLGYFGGFGFRGGGLAFGRGGLGRSGRWCSCWRAFGRLGAWQAIMPGTAGGCAGPEYASFISTVAPFARFSTA